MKKNAEIVFIVLLAVCIVACGAFGIYAGDYYHADEWALECMEGAERTADGNYLFVPENAKAGFIFYPGGKVEAKAYAPLLKACEKEGILCVIATMPANLAILKINAADGIKKQFPEINNWYIGGHSLGGAMASSYLDKHRKEYKGLILLSAYSTVDFSDEALSVLSIYGSEDKVLNRDKYEKNRKNLPSTFTEKVIEGGCHAYFGSYGAQKKDGVPTITCEVQTALTKDYIVDFVYSSIE